MLTIYKKDLTNQVIRVNPEFYATLSLGNGKNKRIITPLNKAQGICADLGGCGFILRKGEDTLNREGFIPNKAFHVKTAVKRSNEELLALKKAKKEFGLAIENKYNVDVQHGLTKDQIWSKYAQKAIIWA